GEEGDRRGAGKAVAHGRWSELAREARRDQALLQLADDPAGLRERQVHRRLRHRPRPASARRTAADRGGGVQGLVWLLWYVPRQLPGPGRCGATSVQTLYLGSSSGAARGRHSVHLGSANLRPTTTGSVP